MFGIFDSKNKKAVKKWEKDHLEIVSLAGNVISAYATNDEQKVRDALRILNKVTTEHLMNEDIEFYKMMRDQKRMTQQTERLIKDFKDSFSGVKLELINFLTNYSKNDSVIDEDFFKKFNELVEIVSERISYEENNLYMLLHKH